MTGNKYNCTDDLQYLYIIYYFTITKKAHSKHSYTNTVPVCHLRDDVMTVLVIYKITDTRKTMLMCSSSTGLTDCSVSHHAHI